MIYWDPASKKQRLGGWLRKRRRGSLCFDSFAICPPPLPPSSGGVAGESERTPAKRGGVYARGHASAQSDMAWQPSNETILEAADNYVINALNYIDKLNESFNPAALKCFELKHQEEVEWLQLAKQERRPGCEIDWDSLLCWPRTPPGTLATLPCLEELNGIRYDSTREWNWLMN